MRVRTALAACLAAMAWWGGNTATARAQVSPESSTVRGYDDTKAERLFGELMSPFCPGLTLATCPSPGADSLRQDIRDRLDRGETPRAIRATYAADWGEQILGAPRLRGWGVVLWVAPGLVLVLGAAGLTVWLRAKTRGTALGAGDQPAPADDGAGDDPALRKRLEQELAAFEKDG
jgi:cytochrome c-type biogenesis protein CcmH/NrfF